MKTSTKIITAAFLLLTIMLVIYDVELKAEYLAGDYKNPYHDYHTNDIKDFDEIEINGSCLMDVELKQGDFAVRTHDHAQDNVTFTKAGNRLVVNVDMDKNPTTVISYNKTVTVNGKASTTKTVAESSQIPPEYRLNRISITCPNLKLLKTTDIFTVKGKLLPGARFTRTPDEMRREITLQSFKLDSLAIQSYGTAFVYLHVDKIKALGISIYKDSKVLIDGSNEVQKASLQANNGSELDISESIVIPSLTYHFADSAKILMPGAMLKEFGKH